MLNDAVPATLAPAAAQRKRKVAGSLKHDRPHKCSKQSKAVTSLLLSRSFVAQDSVVEPPKEETKKTKKKRDPKSKQAVRQRLQKTLISVKPGAGIGKQHGSGNWTGRPGKGAVLVKPATHHGEGGRVLGSVLRSTLSVHQDPLSFAPVDSNINNQPQTLLIPSGPSALERAEDC